MGSKGIDLIEQAQRVAEGVMLELHANTWRYNQLVNQQREIVVKRRMEVLTTDTALKELRDLEPERYAELTGTAKAEGAAGGDDKAGADEKAAEVGETAGAATEDSATEDSAAADSVTERTRPTRPT